MDPIIRWAGSKRALLPKLRKYWPGHGKYVEPFCGSSCLYFDIEPASAVLGDINKELISAYRTIRRNPQRVAECLLRLPITRATYYRLRAQDPFDLSECELAARFLFLNRLCFNGIYRTNRDGRFNVPYAKPKRKVRFSAEPLIEASGLLRKATLLTEDFEETVSHAEPGDLVYLDPPYAVENRRIFAEYQAERFTTKDLKRLRGVLTDLDRKGIAFVVSYAASAEGQALVHGWETRKVRTRRNVAGFVGHRRAAYELLATNASARQWQ
jgi:DNA adenine methylase